MGGSEVKITADTNVLVRAVMQDDPKQARHAAHVLQQAELIAVPIPVLCEFVWVLRRIYKKSTAEISGAIRQLAQSSNVVANKPAIEAGLAVLDGGGDFADGALAYEGECLGAEEFVSFDLKAVSVLRSQGGRARVLS